MASCKQLLYFSTSLTFALQMAIFKCSERAIDPSASPPSCYVYACEHEEKIKLGLRVLIHCPRMQTERAELKCDGMWTIQPKQSFALGPRRVMIS